MTAIGQFLLALDTGPGPVPTHPKGLSVFKRG
jgi:hypothetical protein